MDLLAGWGHGGPRSLGTSPVLLQHPAAVLTALAVTGSCTAWVHGVIACQETCRPLAIALIASDRKVRQERLGTWLCSVEPVTTSASFSVPRRPVVRAPSGSATDRRHGEHHADVPGVPAR
jgi:hypothetical protein